MKRVKNIFFCHGGLYGIFMYLGAIKELNRHREKLSLSDLRIYGSSAGAPLGLICIMVLYDIIQIDDMIRMLNQFYDKERSFTPHITPLCIEMLESMCIQFIDDRAKIVKLANKHLRIGVSQPAQFRFIRKYKSIEDLLHCMMLSSNLVLLSSYPAYHNGICSIDAGYRINATHLPKQCLMIYNYGIQFPECMYLPTQSERRMSQKKGISFMKRRFLSENILEDARSDWCWYNNSELYLSMVFFIQTYLVYKNTNWLDKINSFQYQCRTEISSDSGESHIHHTENYGDCPVIH